MRTSLRLFTPALLLLIALATPMQSASAEDVSQRVEEIVKRMYSRSIDSIWYDVTDLKLLPREAGDVVLARAKSEVQPVVRLGLARAACNLGKHREGAKLLIDLINESDNPKLRKQAITALGLTPQLFGDPSVSKALHDIFEAEKDPMTRVLLGRSLWRLTNDPKYPSYLFKTIEHKDPVVANEAALVLAENGRMPLVRKHLLRIFSDPTPQGERALMLLRQSKQESREEDIARENPEATDDMDRALDMLREVMLKVQQYYVDGDKAENVQKMASAAANAMVNSLDPFSGYLDEEDVETMMEQLEEHYSGIGAYVGMRNEIFTIIAPIYGGPAYRAGLKSLDQVLEVNDKKTTDMKFEKVISHLKGPAGTPVRVKIYRKGWTEPQEFTIIRDEIETRSVHHAMLPGDIGYVRLVRFGERTAEYLDEALDDLERRGMQGLVMDLRDNPGGLLQSAVDVADRFLDGEKLIVSSRGREGARRQRNFWASNQVTHPELPMVVLINGGSASASEIVSGALKDWGRATVIGETSYGKGSVQSILRMRSTDNRTRLRLTVAKYFLPSKVCIHGTGVEPDVTCEPETMPSWQVDLILKHRQEGTYQDYARRLWNEAINPLVDALAGDNNALAADLRDLNSFNLQKVLDRRPPKDAAPERHARYDRLQDLVKRLRNDADLAETVHRVAREHGWRPQAGTGDILAELPTMRRHFLKDIYHIAEGDGMSTELYDDFEPFYTELGTDVPDTFREAVRREIRRLLRQRVADDQGAEFVVDVQEDLQLQRGIWEVLGKLGIKDMKIEDYKMFPTKFSASAVEGSAEVSTPR